MKKHNVTKRHGVKVVSKFKADKNRVLFPRPAVFSCKKDYERSREASKARREVSEYV